jgi:oxygen-independent coproporphyrinogen-3 oxidase
MFCYIHIPFCESKCKYCRFASFWNIQEKSIEKYVDFLCSGIDTSQISDTLLESIYFWWGTPSTLTSEQIERIIITLKNHSLFSEDIEITLESTPNKISESTVLHWKNIGVNRLSIWVQSLNSKALYAIGRHDKGDILNAIKIIEKVWFDNVSVDFIIGLPHVQKWECKKDIEYILTHFPFIKHVSVYMLEDYYNTTDDDSSKFQSVTYPNDWNHLWISEDDYEEEYFSIATFLENAWFHRYEISNFARDKYECKHNIAYWNHSEVLAFGLWASWFLNRKRYTYSEDFISFYNHENIFEEYLTKEDVFLETILFWLRTRGLSADIYKKLNAEKIEYFIQQKLLYKHTDKTLKLTHKWVLLLDYIIKEII